MSKAFYFDMTNCIGCRACQIACKDRKDLPVGILFRQVRTYECGEYPKPGYYHLSSTCNHCEQPACMAVCPKDAYSKDQATGAVIHDDGKCIGCQACVAACPYEVPQYVVESNLVHKCDMCIDLVSEGEDPACVSACPMRALEWGDLDDLKAKHPDAVNKVAVLPDPSTSPNVLIDAKDVSYDEGFVQRLV